MITPLSWRDSGRGLAQHVREQFVAQCQAALAPMEQAIKARFEELIENALSSREVHERHDARRDFEQKAPAWIKGTGAAWRQAIVPPTETGRVRLDAATLELIGDEVVERKILSSRLALAIRESASWELNDLRVRMQHLEGGEGIGHSDVLRPEALGQLLVEQWHLVGLTREAWSMVHDVIQRGLVEHATKAYHAANEFLISKGVMRDIDLSSRVKRAGAPPPGARKPHGEAPGAGADQGDMSADGGQWGPPGGQSFAGQGGGGVSGWRRDHQGGAGTRVARRRLPGPARRRPGRSWPAGRGGAGAAASTGPRVDKFPWAPGQAGVVAWPTKRG